MKNDTTHNDSYLGFLLRTFAEVLRFWILDRDTYRSEEFFGVVTFFFGYFASQPDKYISTLAFMPEWLSSFDDLIGWIMVVLGAITVLVVWSNNRTWRIGVSLANMSVWAALAAAFIYQGKAPGMYILPVYVFYIGAAYLRNSWIKEHGQLKRNYFLPAYCAELDNGRDHTNFGAVAKATLSEIRKETRHRLRAYQTRIRF
jgi:hypothetical protein